MLACQPLHHLAAAQILLALGGEVQLMPAPGELGNHGLVVPEVGEMPRDEKNLHALGRPVSFSHVFSMSGVIPR